MFSFPLDMIAKIAQYLRKQRVQRRWRKLQELGMHIGKGVDLPESTWIDTGHCNLISIGDHCGFGAQCLILSHDAQMNEFLDASRIGRVIIHPSSHIGARTVILPGVEIGPRTIVGANSVVSRSLPPDTVCAGSPAKVICTLEEYLAKHRSLMKESKTFDFLTYEIETITPEQNQHLVEGVTSKNAYITGGHSAAARAAKKS
jgi:maltose O-acetyltransferase